MRICQASRRFCLHRFDAAASSFAQEKHRVRFSFCRSGSISREQEWQRAMPTFSLHRLDTPLRCQVLDGEGRMCSGLCLLNYGAELLGGVGGLSLGADGGQR